MKQNNINKEYNRLRRNLSRRVKSLESRGYEVEAPVPARPKKVTEASVRRIKKAAATLEERTYFPDIVTGERRSYGYGRNIERAAAAEKARITRGRGYNELPTPFDLDDIIIDEFEAFIQQAVNMANSNLAGGGNIGRAYFEGVLFRAEVSDDHFQSITIRAEERRKVARNLRDKREQCLDLLSRYIYESDGKGPNGQSDLLLEFMRLAGEDPGNIIPDIYEQDEGLY